MVTYFTCSLVNFTADSKLKVLAYLLIFLIITLSFPLVALVGTFIYIMDHLRLHRLFLSSRRYSCPGELLILLVFLPYNLLIVVIGIALAAPVAAVISVLLWIPAVLVNGKRLVFTLRYWTGKHRYKLSSKAKAFREAKAYDA
jgi:hypothetical protein